MAAGGGGTVVANGAEGEPASAKDSALLRYRPHLVLDGLALAIGAVGAQRGVVWLHEGAHEARAAVATALQERRRAGLVEPELRIELGPDRYLSGESSAVVRALGGGPALPLFRRTPPPTLGPGGAPVLVHNVETLARTALVARTGAAAHHPTALFTVATPGLRVVQEVAENATLTDVLRAAGVTRTPQAVLIGGYGGVWVPWSQAAALVADEAGLRAAGLSSGAGVLLPLSDSACGLAQAALLADYLAGSTAHQCGPCVFGLRAVADSLRLLANGRARRREIPRLVGFVTEIRGRGGCHHPDGAVRMVGSALQTFATDVAAHLSRRGCRQNAAERLVAAAAGC